MANSSLTAVSLDFDTIRSSARDFLRSQPQFKDYDYEGSNMSVLLDVLAYHAWLHAFYTNMDLTESFLDSAQTLGPVISRAKELNYTPRSHRSSECQVNIQFDGPHGSYVLTKGQTFSSTVRDQTLTFSVPETQVLASPNGHFNANVTLAEGPYLADQYVIAYNDPNQRLLLTNPNCDTSSLTVVAFEDGSQTGVRYSRASSLLGLDESSKVHFVEKCERNLYEVRFGDGVVGRRPKDGSRVVFDYRVSQGSLGDGAKVFHINFNPGPTEDATAINVQTISASAGGADAEGIEAIRFKAPRHFQVQERAVGDEDYADILREQFPEVRDAAVFGGDLLDPPQFRKVFVAVDLTGIEGLPEGKRQAYFNFLRPRCPKTTLPVITTPERVFLQLTLQVDYAVEKSALAPVSFEALVSTSILEWADANLDRFGAHFRASRLSGAVGRSSDAVLGSTIQSRLYRKVRPARGEPYRAAIDFFQPLYNAYPTAGRSRFPSNLEYTIGSSPFTLASGEYVTLRDDGAGTLSAVKLIGADAVVVQRTVGTVDYASGRVSITDLRPRDYAPPDLKIYALPATRGDASAPLSVILNVEADEVRITATQITGEPEEVTE